ncbi:glycosyltransferase family 4 protein [Pacificoceanicola onchidii]|uniref:glycosyltransferase family 4 protein n=1 Tax=Pacificoceanicola onchidii TaxID=2562685 RepID=UPI0010A62E4A|nr:glycosyltransferase family 4 protein [Pacificoceanicola onchidii]
MAKGRLRIAYLCDMSPLDRNLYSGGNARIHDALCRHAGDVTILPQSWYGAEPVRRLIAALPEALNLRLRWRVQLLLSRMVARGVERVLREGEFDVLFGAYSFQSMAGVRVPDGMVSAYTSDATQTVYRTSEIGQAHDRLFRFGHLLDGWVERREREMLQQMDLLLWPSDWLQKAAEARYDLSPETAHLVPWGANLDAWPDPVSRSIDLDAPVRLLLIGRNWFAKGGPIAFDCMKALREQGFDARLTVIGCVPPEFHVNEWVTVHPQLNKAVPADLADFNAELAKAHFLVQPSFESYGFAYCEASAFGLPSLCLRVGGVPVRDGINGHALPLGSGADDFAALVRGYIENPGSYAALSSAARAEFEAHLNWDAWGRRVAGLLHEAVDRKRVSPDQA